MSQKFNLIFSLLFFVADIKGDVKQIKEPSILVFQYPIIDSKCEVKKTGEQGICIKAYDCHTIKNFKNANVCWFERDIPIVCCPDTVVHEEKELKVEQSISDKYCQIYFAKFIESTKDMNNDDTKNLPEFPHMASIGWTQSDKSILWKCAGSLVSEIYVLTAAHCAFSQGILPDVVRLGEHNSENNSYSHTAQEHYINKIINHPDYKPPEIYNDIALIKLNTPAIINSHIRPACLWNKNEIYNDTAIATGWNHVEHECEIYDVLQKYELTNCPNTKCDLKFDKNRKMSNGIVDTQICYGYPNLIGDESCHSDSGGPIQIKRVFNTGIEYHVVGVTSFGKICNVNDPIIFTRVSSFADWIESIVWSDEDCKLHND